MREMGRHRGAPLLPSGADVFSFVRAFLTWGVLSQGVAVLGCDAIPLSVAPRSCSKLSLSFFLVLSLRARAHACIHGVAVRKSKWHRMVPGWRRSLTSEWLPRPVFESRTVVQTRQTGGVPSSSAHFPSIMRRAYISICRSISAMVSPPISSVSPRFVPLAQWSPSSQRWTRKLFVTRQRVKDSTVIKRGSNGAHWNLPSWAHLLSKFWVHISDQMGPQRRRKRSSGLAEGSDNILVVSEEGDVDEKPYAPVEEEDDTESEELDAIVEDEPEEDTVKPEKVRPCLHHQIFYDKRTTIVPPDPLSRQLPGTASTCTMQQKKNVLCSLTLRDLITPACLKISRGKRKKAEVLPTRELRTKSRRGVSVLGGEKKLPPPKAKTRKPRTKGECVAV